MDDRLLVAVGKRLSTYLPEEAAIARFGGDEFVILLDRLASPLEREQTVQQLCEALAIGYKIDGYELFTTVSIGVAPSSPHYEKPEELLRNADIALYEAKRRGRSQFVIFDQQMYEQVTARSQLEEDLRRAVQALGNE